MNDTAQPLTAIEQKFILHWGEMGLRWGINRTVAQIHALLYLAPKPLNAEQIAATLGVARSNVSTSLKDLQSWRIVRRVHVLGDKRDHFESLQDVWEMFRTVLDERKRREIDPTLEVLRDCLAAAETDRRAGAHTRERLLALQQFFETTTGWYVQMRGWPAATLTKLMRLGDKVLKVIGPGS